MKDLFYSSISVALKITVKYILKCISEWSFWIARFALNNIRSTCYQNILQRIKRYSIFCQKITVHKKNWIEFCAKNKIYFPHLLSCKNNIKINCFAQKVICTNQQSVKQKIWINDRVSDINIIFEDTFRCTHSKIHLFIKMIFTRLINYIR